MDLLDAAVDKARDTVADKPYEPSDRDLTTTIAEQAGVGAVKYADLSTSRTKDYVFDVDRMVSFNGNTGVYLQYAHTRICSILRKAGDASSEVDPTVPLHPAERELALALDAFGDALAEVGRILEPHRLCGYLFDLAKAFTDLYEACPVLSAEPPVRANRIALCRLTARTLGEGAGPARYRRTRTHVGAAATAPSPMASGWSAFRRRAREHVGVAVTWDGVAA